MEKVPKSVRTTGLAVALVLLVGLEWSSRQRPERFFAAKAARLDGFSAVPAGGLAYWLSLADVAPDLVSDSDGSSTITFLENGRELTGHTRHEEIRRRGGFYSHWGSAILFSSSDGSDPRSNRYLYELLLPPTAPSWYTVAQLVSLGVASFLLLLWLYGASGGSLARTVAWAVSSGLALALVAGLIVRYSEPVRELRVVRAAVARSDLEPTGEKVIDPQRPRTQHLLRGENDLAFVAYGEVRPTAEPQTISMLPSGEHGATDGYLTLVSGAEFRSVDSLDVLASDLELMVLEVEVVRGDSLTLRFSGTTKGSQAVGGGHESDLTSSQISFPVTPSREAQTLRFRRPVLGAAIDRVLQVALQGSRESDEPAVARVVSLRFSRRLDAFTSQLTGYDPVELSGSLRPSLWQSVPGRHSLPFEQGGRSMLKLAVGAFAEGSTTTIDYAVAVTRRDGRRSTLHSGSIRPKEGWRELVLDLPEGDVRELLLEGQRLPSRTALLWSGARVINRQLPARRVVLVLADTLRADALGCYGRVGDPTPVLDSLASQGVRFDRAFSQSYWTRPSIASIMTGHYVAATGVQALHHRLPQAYDTLAERLATGGFTTVGVVPNANGGADAGQDQGFDRMRLRGSLTPRQIHEADLLIDDVVFPLLDELDEDDVFLYVHVIDPHGPYGPWDPPAPGVLSPQSDPVLPFDSRFDHSWNTEPTAAKRKELYDHDVRRMDRALGKLFVEIDRRWQSADGALPIVAFVSDHGEHLGERGLWGHGFADLYPEVVQVPMIIRAPGRIRPSTEVPQPVEIRHLGSTLLELSGLLSPATELAPQSAPVSLLAAIEPAGALRSPAFALSAAENGESGVFSLFGRKYSYVFRIEDYSTRVALFSDSRLQHPVTSVPIRLSVESALHRVRTAYLESQERVRRRGWVDIEGSTRVIDAEARKNLRALGYLDD